MPSDPSKALAPNPVFAPVPRQVFKPRLALPPLAPITRFSRPVSTPEYYHASVASSGKTLEQPRENGFILHGMSSLSREDWQGALDKVVAVNPGTCLRLVGDGRKARWESDGLPPRLRMIENLDWDEYSSAGSEFMYETPLPLYTGPTLELLVVARGGGRILLMIRSQHGVMDGMGCMHFFRELLRALRGEPLLGSNAQFSDVEVMLSVGATRSTSKHVKTTALTGAPQGEERGDEWRRISMKPTKALLAKVAVAMASYAHQRSDLPMLIGVPVDLRRHVPGLLSTANYTNMILVRLDKGDGVEDFRRKLQHMLDQKMETMYPRILDLFKWLPLRWLDRLLSRNEKNYRTKKALETGVISNLGGYKAAEFSAPGFSAEGMFLVPIRGSVFGALVGVEDRVELTLNIPKVLASNGRFDDFLAHLQRQLAA